MISRQPVVLTMLAVVSMTGCVAVGERYTPVDDADPSKALIYIYRPHPRPNLLLTNTYNYVHAADAYIDDEKWASLNVNAYTFAELTPGRYTFSMRDNVAGGPLTKLDVEVLAGQQYFFRYDFHFVPTTEFSLRVIPEEMAETEIAKTRRVQPSRKSR